MRDGNGVEHILVVVANGELEMARNNTLLFARIRVMIVRIASLRSMNE